MASIADVADSFFKACETGQGWSACREYCAPDATFSAQAEPLADVTSLEAYTDWMKGIFGPIPDASYQLKAFATDEARNSVLAYAVFSGTHTGEGGPVAPTGKSMETDYVYVMEFAGGKIRHLTKIWNSGVALRALGWM
jgi:predicted ester cyclase